MICVHHFRTLLIVAYSVSGVTSFFQGSRRPENTWLPSPSTTHLHTAATVTLENVLEMPEPIWTPGSEDTLYNFGPASSYDQVLYTAERPGNPTTKDTDAQVTKEEVYEWIDYIQSQGVSVVLALLDEKEFDIYPEPGLLQMYKEAGITCHVTPLGVGWENIMKIISNAEQEGKKVVTHCTGGIGRCGRVAASWLVFRHDLTPKQATAAAVVQAFQSGMKRLGDTTKLAQWIGKSE
eukprot:CAMPEP_0178897130 /NCGR_PEP_ID=MMETSP0786-20121207/1570_1 /TAXON_ID=186022 /ORGANISM="Thalassionema frauenfeldii, Strain CCMP 1798" /LENGTH=235 /DNA_ID=CAMNT_0020567635 /DNA_START=61 /DNA_END=768 /DNA_ORIENTATION=-